MDAIMGPRDRDHDYRNTKLPAPNDLVVYSAPDHPIYVLDQQSPNGYGEFEVGRMLTNRFPYQGLGKSADAPAVQDNSSDGGIRTLLESEAGDAWSFLDLSGPFCELQRFNNLDTCVSNWQTLKCAVPQSEELGLVVLSEFADTAFQSPNERSLPSNHLTGERDLSGSLSNSTESIAGSSRQTIWDATTGQEVHFRTKRRLTSQERADSKAIRTLGGQCARCRMGKRKCHRSHNRLALQCSVGGHDSREDNSPSSVEVVAHKARPPTTVLRWVVDIPDTELLHPRQEGHPGDTVDAAEVGSWLPQLDCVACSSTKEHQAEERQTEARIAEQGSPANKGGLCPRPPCEGINVSGATDASGQSGKRGNTGAQSVHNGSDDADKTGEVRIAKRAKKTAEEKQLELRCPEFAAGRETLGKCWTFSSKSVDRLKSDHLKKDHGFAKDKLDIGRRKQGDTEPDLWRRLFLKLNPNWLDEHPNTPSPYVNPNHDLPEVVPFNSPISLDEPRRPAHQMRDIDENASGSAFVDNMLPWNQPQAPPYQISPSQRTHALAALSTSTSVAPPSTPFNIQVPQTPFVYAGNSQFNQFQASPYHFSPYDQEIAFNLPPPLEHLDSPSASHALGGYTDSVSQDFAIFRDFVVAQSDIVLNEHNALSSSASAGARNFDQTATTSVTPASQCSHSGKCEICRCKRHDVSCKLQFFEGAENCAGCGGFFTWSRKAESFLRLGDLTSQICRCKWHERPCLEYREQYDAGTCIGCGGWLAFSDRAGSLLISPDLLGEARGLEDDFFSAIVNHEDSAT